MNADTDNKAIYQITVSGKLDKRWEDWFNDTQIIDMQISTEINKDGNPMTVFTGPVIDQVALRGLMTRIWDLNMALISIKRIEDRIEYEGVNPDETDVENF